MSQENVEVFKRAFDAINRRDADALVVELDPEVEWHSAKGRSRVAPRPVRDPL
jgi:hypothetical protein